MKKNIKQNLEPWFKGHNLSWLKNRTIFLTVHGSRAYGINTPDSDIDIKGLAIPPPNYYYGFYKNFEQAESSTPYDMVIYGLEKFFKLASACNPNIIEILNTDPEDWIIKHELFEQLYEKRDLFLSRKARYTFSGYALSQLKRIKSHKKWLLQPPTHQPTREEFGLPQLRKMNAGSIGAIQKLVDENHMLNESVMQLFNKERNYQSALKDWKQYQNWKVNRNKKRAKLEAEFGYDLKHATHLVRLMLMCKEILVDGKVIVKRPDAEMLRSIRSGAWTYDELLAWAEDMENTMDEFYEASPLPHAPRFDELNELCQKVTKAALDGALANE